MLKKFSIHIGVPALIALTALLGVSSVDAQTYGNTGTNGTGSGLTENATGTTGAGGTTGTGTTTGGSGVGLPDTGGTGTMNTTGTTPGLPNTGLGGNAAMMISLLLGSAVVLGVGTTLLSRRFVS